MKIWISFVNAFSYLFGALDTKPNSASLRKIAATWTMILVTIAHSKFVSATTINTILMIDYLFIALLLGLVTAENIIFFLQNKKDSNSPVKKSDPEV
jgi:hypothetical protein